MPRQHLRSRCGPPAALVSLRNLLILLRRIASWLRSEHLADFPGREQRIRPKEGSISVWRRTASWLTSEHSADFPGGVQWTRPKEGCIIVWAVRDVRSVSVRRTLLNLRDCRERPWRRLTRPLLRAALLSLRDVRSLLRRTASCLRPEHSAEFHAGDLWTRSQGDFFGVWAVRNVGSF